VLSDGRTLEDPHELTAAMMDAFIEIRGAAGLPEELTVVEKAVAEESASGCSYLAASRSLDSRGAYLGLSWPQLHRRVQAVAGHIADVSEDVEVSSPQALADLTRQRETLEIALYLVGGIEVASRVANERVIEKSRRLPTL